MAGDVKKSGILQLMVKGGAQSKADVSGVEQAFSKLKTAVGLAASAYGLMKAASAAMDWAEEAARVNDVERAYRNLAEEQGIHYTQMLEQMRKATGDTVADMELMINFNQAAMLGLPLDRYDEMLQIARGAAVATGQSMEFMLQSITTGLGRQSKMILDNLGILFDANSANQAYAQSVGKSAAALAEQERKMAFVNMALDKGLANLDKMGGVVGSETDPFVRLRTEVEELKQALGQEFLRVLSEATTGISDVLETWTETLGSEGIAGVLADLPLDKIQALAGLFAGAKVGGLFGPMGAMAGAVLGGGLGWATGPASESQLRDQARATAAERQAQELIDERNRLLERSRAIHLELSRLHSEGLGVQYMEGIVASLSDANRYLGEIKTFGELGMGQALFDGVETQLEGLLLRLEQAEEGFGNITRPRPHGLQHGQELPEVPELGEVVGEMSKVTGQELVDSLGVWDQFAVGVVGSLEHVKENMGGFQTAVQSMILAQNMSAKSLGIALQSQLRQILAAKAAEAGVLAMMELAYATAAAAMLDFRAAGQHLVAAGKFGLIAGVAGAAASIGPPMNTGVGYDSGGSYLDPDAAEEERAGGGSRSIHVNRMAPTHITVNHSYYGNVYFGSQSQASAGSVQEEIDAGAVYLPEEVA